MQGGLITHLAPWKGHGERPVGLTVAQAKKAPPLGEIPALSAEQQHGINVRLRETHEGP